MKSVRAKPQTHAKPAKTLKLSKNKRRRAKRYVMAASPVPVNRPKRAAPRETKKSVARLIRRDMKSSKSRSSMDVDHDALAVKGSQFLGQLAIDAGETSIPAGEILLEVDLNPVALQGRLAKFGQLYQMVGPNGRNMAYRADYKSTTSTFANGSFGMFILFGSDLDDFRASTPVERLRKASSSSEFRTTLVYKDISIAAPWPEDLTEQYIAPPEDFGAGWSTYAALVILAMTELNRPLNVLPGVTFTFADLFIHYDLLLSKPKLETNPAGERITIRGESEVDTISGTQVKTLAPFETALDIDATFDGDAVAATSSSKLSMLRSGLRTAKFSDSSAVVRHSFDWTRADSDSDYRRTVASALRYDERWGGFFGTVAEAVTSVIPGGSAIVSVVNGIGKLFQGFKNKSTKTLTVDSAAKAVPAFGYGSNLGPSANPTQFYDGGPLNAIGQSANRFSNFGPVWTDASAVTTDAGVLYGSDGVEVAQGVLKQPELPAGVWDGQAGFAGPLPYIPLDYGSSGTTSLDTRTTTNPAAAFRSLYWPRSNPFTKTTVPPGGVWGYNPYVRPGVATSDSNVLYNRNEVGGGGVFNGAMIDGAQAGVGQLDITMSAYPTGTTDGAPARSLVITPKSGRYLKEISAVQAFNWFNYEKIETHPFYDKMLPHTKERWMMTRQVLRDLSNAPYLTKLQARFRFRFAHDPKMVFPAPPLFYSLRPTGAKLGPAYGAIKEAVAPSGTVARWTSYVLGHARTLKEGTLSPGSTCKPMKTGRKTDPEIDLAVAAACPKNCILGGERCRACRIISKLLVKQMSESTEPSETPVEKSPSGASEARVLKPSAMKKRFDDLQESEDELIDRVYKPLEGG